MEWIQQNFELLFALCFLGTFGRIAFFAWRRHRMGSMHPPFTPSDVRFAEKYVSGSSDRTFLTRFGGAKNALAVTVLKDALLVEPLGIFKWLMPPGFNDLEHRVPRSNILRIEAASSFGRNTVRIEIRGQDGSTRTLELAIRNRDQFLSALRS